MVASSVLKKLAVILRGLPGSGKSHLTSRILACQPDSVVCSADAFFMQEGGDYNFEARKLNLAHNFCMARYSSAHKSRAPVVVVDNTNTGRWEYANYVAVAGLLPEYETVIVEMACGSLAEALKAGERNTHGVRAKGIEAMFRRYEKDPCAVTVEDLECRLHMPRPRRRLPPPPPPPPPPP
jgi:hypothetical protein